MNKLNVLLSFCVLALVVVCFLSVYGPERFKEEQTARETVVKQRLTEIRRAEERFRRATGTYAGDFKTLVGGGWLADSMQYIPFSGGKRFDLASTTQTTKTGRTLPLMECGAAYRDYLRGLDANSIANLVEDAGVSRRYPGLKIGDITTPNDNLGNWE